MNLITKGNFESIFGKFLIRELERYKEHISQNILLSFDNVDSKVQKDGQIVRVAILYEPCAVMPENYSSKKVQKFDLVFCLNSFFQNESYKRIVTLQQPIRRPNKSFFGNTNRVNSHLVFIGDNKFSASKTSQYSYRRKLISSLERQNIRVDLYGPNWNSGRVLEFRRRFAALRRGLRNPSCFSIGEVFSSCFKHQASHVGESIDKMLTQSRYNFAIVIENDRFALTEKVYDSIFSGCVTFYKGPHLKNPVLENVLIRLPEDIQNAVELIGSEMLQDQSHRIESMKTYVSDAESMIETSPEYIARQIAKGIESFLLDMEHTDNDR